MTSKQSGFRASFLHIKLRSLVLFLTIFFLACPDPDNSKKYTVSFDANGGTGGPKNLVISSMLSFTEPSNEPTRKASGSVIKYYFGGWYTSAPAIEQDGKTKYKFGARLESDLILYARWYTARPTSKQELQDLLKDADENTNLNLIDVGLITDMDKLIEFRAFSGASSFHYDITRWDTSAVTNMSDMFNSSTEFNEDIGDWDTSAVSNMDSMFVNASAFNQDISRWSNKAQPTVEGMFAGALSMEEANKATWMPVTPPF